MGMRPPPMWKEMGSAGLHAGLPEAVPIAVAGVEGVVEAAGHEVGATDEGVVGDSMDFLGRQLGVVDGEAGQAVPAARVAGAEPVDPVVVDAVDLGHHFHVLEVLAGAGDAVEDLGVDAVGLHVH